MFSFLGILMAMIGGIILGLTIGLWGIPFAFVWGLACGHIGAKLDQRNW